MKFKIVADSSADVTSLDGVDFENVPLKVITAEREFIDTADLDVKEMNNYLSKYKGRSSSSCPNAGEWEDSFGDADCVFGVAITSQLSGSFNSLRTAAEEYMAKHPGRKVFAMNSLSAGPELALFVDKLRELILSGEYNFEQIVEKILDYQKHTGLVFSLQSMKNFVNNGRINPAIAKICGLLGIRVISIGNPKGEIEIKTKSRGADKAVNDIYKLMKSEGYIGGKVRIDHCENTEMANKTIEKILSEYPEANIQLCELRGLCSFYAEIGGLLVAFEKAPKN